MYVQFGSRFGIIVNHCSLQCPVILLRQMFVFEFIGILVLQTLFGTWGWNLLNGFNQKLEPKSKSNRLFIINQGWLKQQSDRMGQSYNQGEGWNTSCNHSCHLQFSRVQKEFRIALLVSNLCLRAVSSKTTKIDPPYQLGLWLKPDNSPAFLFARHRQSKPTCCLSRLQVRWPQAISQLEACDGNCRWHWRSSCRLPEKFYVPPWWESRVNANDAFCSTMSLHQI